MKTLLLTSPWLVTLAWLGVHNWLEAGGQGFGLLLVACALLVVGVGMISYYVETRRWTRDGRGRHGW